MPRPVSNVVRMPAPAPLPKRRTARVKLTEAVVRDFPLQGQDPTFGPDERHPAIYHDEELRGFFVLCHRTSKTYYCQHDIAGKSVVVKVARTTEMTPTEARKKAAKIILTMRDGVNPNEQKRQRALDKLAKEETEAFTLADAVKLHLFERKRERSTKTIHGYERIFETHLKPFMDKPLVWLGEHQEVIEALHDSITRHGWDTESKKGRGRKKRRPAPYAANGMVRAFRAVYNYARVKKRHLNLPEFRPIEMNQEEAKDCAMTLEQLPGWYAQVMKMHPIHRDLNLFMLFTGNRSTATRSMRWEDIDLTGAVNDVPSVYVPAPKGGRTKAFYIPLSDYLVELLKIRRGCKITKSDFPNSPWVFPSPDSDTGYVKDPSEVIFKSKRRDGSEESDNISPHDLRHTYITCAQFAGVNVTDIAFLVNQRPKSITVAYMKALLPPLRDRQQQITNYIREHAKIGQKGTTDRK